MTPTKTVAFMGASGGIGLETLKRTLAAGHQCVALCRQPATLTAVLPLESNPNLRVIQGNAHDINTVSQLLRKDDGTLVDTLVSTIGNKPSLTAKMDPRKCHCLDLPQNMHCYFSSARTSNSINAAC